VPAPIDFLILTNLQQALQGISLGEGYHFDVRGTAVKMDPNQNVEELVELDDPMRPFIAIEVLPLVFEYQPARRVKVRRPLKVHWVKDSQAERDEDLLETFAKGCADVEKAIAVDITRGGYAIDTRISRATLNRDEDGSEVWVEIDAEVLLIRTYGEPNA
jgi:hypothetical protein